MNTSPSFLARAMGIALLAALAACGGGGSDSAATQAAGGGSTASAAALTQGPISGFGSIIVNGVRFDDSGASIEDGDGNRQGRDALRLGMTVEVQSAALRGASTGVASNVRFGNQVKGPVESGSITATGFVVLGQAVDVSASTVFDGISGGTAGLSGGALVEVYGLPDAATGHVVASRVEAQSALAAYKLRGTVSALDTAAKTFSIGAATLSYAGVASVPTALANGVTVRTTLATTQASGRWVVTSMRVESSRIEDHAEAHLRGSITAFTSTTQFSVNGVAVDASSASFPDGSSGLALGVRVEVEGSSSNGVLTATKVEIESRHTADDDRKTELHGAITSLNASAKTFVLRGLTVSYAGSVTYSRGTEATLAVNRQVEVKGTPATSATGGTIINATTIKFED